VRRQRGSVTPVWLALVLGTLLLFIVLVDREWVTYQLNKVEQTADFAAEAGASTAEITYPVLVHGVRHHYVDETTCEPGAQPTDPPLCTTTTIHQQRSENHDDCAGTKQQLEGAAWRQQCHCDPGPSEGAWTCLKAELSKVRAPEVTFPADLDDVVMATFYANWSDHAGGRVSFTAGVSPETATRSVRLPFKFIVSSPFGGESWLGQTRQLYGRAIVQIPPLTFN
jgi:hypothetical protein